VEWGSYREGSREGLWTIRTSTWQEEGWQIYEELGAFEQSRREGRWQATTTFKAHSSLEMQLSEGAQHAGPWRSEDQVSDLQEGRAEGSYTHGIRSGRWLLWESRAETGEQLASGECLRDDGELLWEWARGDASSDEDEPSPSAGSGLLTVFESAYKVPLPEGSEPSADSEQEAADPASTPTTFPANKVLFEACPPS